VDDGDRRERDADQGAAPGGLSAVRYDIVGAKIAARSSDFATWAQPRCVPPIISIGEGEKGWLADLLIYDLRSRSGMTPPDAGGDGRRQRARARAEDRGAQHSRDRRQRDAPARHRRLLAGRRRHGHPVFPALALFARLRGLLKWASPAIRSA
jgi:hypothetical protein